MEKFSLLCHIIYPDAWVHLKSIAMVSAILTPLPFAIAIAIFIITKITKTERKQKFWGIYF
jgi:hypothetical protein